MLLSYAVNRINVWQVFICYGLLFATYYFLYKSELNYKLIIWGAILIRATLLFSEPNLSDDIYRFVWDGRMTANAENPYLHIPAKFIENNGKAPGLDNDLLSKMNSPNYYTVYPPICQYLFASSTLITVSNFLANTIVLKLFLLISELFTFLIIVRLLHSFGSKSALLSIYAFNPLVVIEIMGNAHLEGLMVLFLLCTFYFLKKKQYYLSSILFSCAVAVKLLPLFLIPAILKYLPANKRIPSLLISIITLCVLFIPFYDKQIFINLLESVNLYFQKFEFNASIYYLVRETAYMLTDHKVIEVAGTSLGFLTLVLLLLLTFQFKLRQTSDLIAYSFFAFLLYFACATTVHPWYLITIVALSVFVPYKTGLIWSAAIILSYFTYMSFPYKESLFLVLVEYLTVYSYFIFEMRDKKTPQV